MFFLNLSFLQKILTSGSLKNEHKMSSVRPSVSLSVEAKNLKHSYQERAQVQALVLEACSS